MKLAIDIDGVLRDFTGQLEKIYLKHYPNHEVLDKTNYDLSYWFPIGKKIYDFTFDKHVKDIYLYAPTYPKAKQFLEKLIELGHTVSIVTSQPNEKCIKYTIDWLEKNKLKYDNLIFESKKYKVDVDVLLDDYTKNLIEFVETKRLAVCMDRPWNKDWEGHRIKNYTQFINLIENAS